MEIKYIFINTDKGRILRPLLILYDGAPRLTQDHLTKLASGEINFRSLIIEGVVEWVDAEEEEDLYVAPRRLCFQKPSPKVTALALQAAP